MNLPVSTDYSVKSPQGNNDTPQNGDQFIFGFSSMAVSLEAFHPSMAQSQMLWNIYQENVAPVLMVFHKPSLFRLVYKAASNTSYIDRASEAVVFAVYFAAVNSMDTRDCGEVMSHDHSSLREYYKFATQQALARAAFFQSSNLAVLQAAVLFLTCLRSKEETDFVWMMMAAIHRKAQGLGLHRDGTSFGLSPFEIEMRRRLWWYIYLLDSQSSGLHAIDTLITEQSYDTKMPLNINDSDISPESTQAPESRVGFTEMTFCLVRAEITTRYRRLIANGPRENDKKHASDILEGRLCELEKIYSTLQEYYLQFCDITVPLQWVTATISRLALARLWVTTHFAQRSMAEEILSIDSPLEQTNRDQLFVTTIEVVEFAFLLETDPRTSGWSWLFAGYPQWHAAVIVLVELCSRPQGVETQRAWVVIQKAVAQWTNRSLNENGITMQTIFNLMERAASVQGRGIYRDLTSKDAL